MLDDLDLRVSIGNWYDFNASLFKKLYVGSRNIRGLAAVTISLIVEVDKVAT